MADITKRLPECDNEGERGRRGERGHRGHRGPIGPTGPAAAEGPPFQPPFVPPTKIFIFARPDGSDSKGNGKSPATAYQTLQRAVRDVPSIIPPDVFYFVDITGVSEVLPIGYTLPAWKGPQSIFFEFTGQLVLTGAVNIVADLTPVSLVPASDAVINASDVTVSTDPITGLVTLTLVSGSRTSWGADGLKGKQVIGTDTSVYHPTVVSTNTTTTISLTSADPPVFPLTVVEPSATLTSADDSFNFVISAINCDSINFKGLRVLTTSPNTFGSIFCDGVGNLIVQTCEIQTPTFQNVASEMTRVISNWCYGFPLFGSTGEGTFFNKGLMDKITTSFDEIGFMSNPVIAIHDMVFDGCDPIEPIFGIDVHQPAVISNLNMTNTLVKNGTGPGLVFHGAYGQLNNCDLSANAASGIVVNKGAGQLRLENVGSSTPNTNFGVEITDGMQVSADVVTTTTNPLAFRGLTGTLGGDILLGSVGPVAWGTVALPPNNVADYTNPGATGAR